jgi:DNA-binding transcriptional LysR family regulator
MDCLQKVTYAVENNVGIAFIPHSIAQMSQKQLVPVLPDQLSQSLDVYYTYPKSLEKQYCS